MNGHRLKSETNEYRMPRRIGIWILLASMLVNCFFLGLLVAPVLRPHPPFPPFGPRGFIDHLTQGLSAADADIMRSIYAKEEPFLTAGHADVDTAMYQLSQTLRKATVDPTELQKDLSAITAAHDKIAQSMGHLIQHASTDLSPDGRRIFADHGLSPPGMPTDEHGHMPPPERPNF